MSENGCSDGNCKLRIDPQIGQHTNGGCRCMRDIPTQQRIQIERKLWVMKNEIERLLYLLTLRSYCGACGKNLEIEWPPPAPEVKDE